MLHKQYLLALVLLASFVLNGLPVFGQTRPLTADLADAAKSLTSDPVEAYAGLQRAGRDDAFAQSLARIAGDQGETSDALDAQGVYFYEQFRAKTAGHFEAVVKKAVELNRIAYEKQRSGAVSSRPAPAPKKARSSRVDGKSIGEFMAQLTGDTGDPNSSSRPVDDDIKIVETETDKTKVSTAEAIKVIDSPEATVTNSEVGKTIFS